MAAVRSAWLRRARGGLAGALRAAGLLLFFSSAAPAAEPVTLTPAHEAHLSGLPVLRGAPFDPGAGGDGPVVVSFFASWCPPCRTEFAHLAELVHVHADDGLRVVAVNVFEAFDDDDGPRLARFLRETAAPFTVVEGTAETRALFGDVSRIPTVFVFDGEGRSVLHFIHERGSTRMTVSAEELEQAVAVALAR